MTNLEIVRAACLKANPALIDHYCCKYQTIKPDDYCDHCLETYPVIHLADVLHAIVMGHAFMDFWLVDINGTFWKNAWLGAGDAGYKERNELGNPHWNLTKDDLSQQSPETLEFLAGLLK